jgi:hypothetical protein
VEFKEGKVQEVEPEPKSLAGEMAEIEIEAEEVMYPSSWKTNKTVRYYFGGGFFEVESIRRDTVGKKRIYLMEAWNLSPADREKAKQEGQQFSPSYSWHLYEPIERKTEISTLLEARVKREEEAKNAAPERS